MMNLGGHCLWQSCFASPPPRNAVGISTKSSPIMPALPEEAQFRISVLSLLYDSARSDFGSIQAQR